MQPLISVIIPCYNYANYVGKAVASVETQSYKNVEIVVVNNGSTDNSLEVLRAMGNRIRLVDQENKGQSGARNSALQEVRGEFVAFLDADDTWHPSKLEKQMRLFQDPEVGLVYTGLTRVDPAGNILSVQMPIHRGRILEKFALSPGAAVVGGESTALIRTKALKEAGVFDTRLSIGSGWDMWRRIASQWKIEFVNEALAFYLQHGNNMSRSLDGYERDTLIKLENFFSDPRSSSVFHLKNRAYSAHLFSLAGAYFQNGDLGKASTLLWRSIAAYPPSLPKRIGQKLFRKLGRV